MSLRADDGTELPVKEGVILDSQETVILHSGDTEQEHQKASSSVHVFRVGFWAIPLLVAGIILTFVLGTFVFTAAIAFFFILMVIRTIANLFRVGP